MSRLSLYRRIIAGDAGAWALPARGLLRVGEALYGTAIALRNARYDRRRSPVVLPVPVISVGNLTVGGTGKTPFVIDLVKRLDRMGLSPAVVSRGYRSAAGEPNDEERLIRRNCQGVICVSDPDRVLASRVAHEDFGADVIVLDDGFQHRRLGRVLDIVLIDATCPFGYDHLLPRGLLREPVTSLRRADVVAVTRCDQVSGAALSRVISSLRGLVGDAAVLQCYHRVTSVERVDGLAVETSLERKRVVLFAGIGQPGAFSTTARSLDVEVVGEHWWPDHHNYARRDIEFLLHSARFPAHDLLLTTEKDAVKLSKLDGLDPAVILVVRIAIDFVDQDGTMLQAALEHALRRD